MALTSRDETDLLLPLIAVSDAGEAFETFLERLRRRTGSSFAALLVRAGSDDEHTFCAGADFVRLAREQRPELPIADRIRQESLRLGRVYSSDEFDAHDPLLRAANARAIRKLGLADARILRVLHEDLVSAWLIIASAHPCSAADAALLASLLPYVAGAVRRFVLDKQQKLAASLDAAGLHRAGTGWIAFDGTSRVLAIASPTIHTIKSAVGHEPRTGHRLREFGPAVERELLEAAAQYAAHPNAPKRTLILLDDPRIEAVLGGFDNGGAVGAVMVASCRHARRAGDARAELFGCLHALSRREADLAVLLADGQSLAEAGQTLGLTIETTRNYSKRLFAKVGVRGQGELVRAVYESCAMLA